MAIARTSGKLIRAPSVRGPVVAPGTTSWFLAFAIAGVMLLPVIYLIIRAVGADQGVWSLLARPRTVRLLINTIGLTVFVTLAATVIAVPLAWLTVRTNLPGRAWWTVALAVPLAVPSYLGAYTLVAALGPRGLLQRAAVEIFGLQWFPEIYGFGGAALALTLFSYPYVYLTTRGALLRLDPSLEEASRILGVGALATFVRVVLPTLRPAIASGALLVSLYVFSDFGAVSFMQFDTFTRAIYIQYQAAFDRTYGAVLSMVLLACTGVVLVMETRTRGRARYHRLGPGARRTQAPVALGKWRLPALAFCGLVTVMGVLLPVFVISYWLIWGFDPWSGLDTVIRAAVTSITVAGLAAVMTTVLALPIAVVAVRGRGWAARLVEGATYAGYALPGMVVALALVYFSINLAWPLYQTLALLLFAYTTLFLPQAVGALRSAFLQVSPHLEEAARMLGDSPWRVSRSITLPLIRPGLTAGAALVFLTTMKELPATLLLAPIGYRTLATTVWSATNDAFYGRAAPAAMLLMIVSFMSVAFLLSDGSRTNAPAVRSQGGD